MSANLCFDAIVGAQKAGRDAQAARMVHRYVGLSLRGRVPPIGDLCSERFGPIFREAMSSNTLMEARRLQSQISRMSVHDLIARGEHAGATAEFSKYMATAPRFGDFMRAESHQAIPAAKPWMTQHGGKLAVAGAVVACIAVAGALTHKALQKRWTDRVERSAEQPIQR